MTKFKEFDEVAGPINKDFRTHLCGELRADQAGQKVRLSGWVHHRRDMGGVIFLVLRDRWGIVQVTCDESISPDAYKVAAEVKNEYVVFVRGTVAVRPAGLENPDMETGQIEVKATELKVLTEAEPSPLVIEQEGYQVNIGYVVCAYDGLDGYVAEQRDLLFGGCFQFLVRPANDDIWFYTEAHERFHRVLRRFCLLLAHNAHNWY